MKNFFQSFFGSALGLIAAVICFFTAFVQHEHVRRLHNQLADANLALDLAKANTDQAKAVVADTLITAQMAGQEIDRLRDALRQSKVAVNEKQGDHNFIYVESDSWVDLATGEKVPAMKRIAPPTPIPIDRIRAFSTFSNSLGTGGWNQ